MSDPNRPDLPGVTAYLSAKDGPGQLEFYAAAFQAEVTTRMDTPDGRVMNATVRINNGCIMLSDAFPEHGHPWVEPQGTVLHLQVDQPQAWWDRAIAAGCTQVMPMDVQFWGDRYGQLKDPYDVMWSIGGPA